ncbi:MAG: hypothetical protein R3B90_20695 [Planctomycetaceae bacterium]
MSRRSRNSWMSRGGGLMAAPRMARRPRRGLTLIDMTISVFVLGLLSAVAMPKFAAALEARQADAALKRIAADLEFARQTAISTSQVCTVRFEAAPDRYTMSGVEHPQHPGRSYVVELSEISAAIRLSGASFNGGNTVTYTIYGLPSSDRHR